MTNKQQPSKKSVPFRWKNSLNESEIAALTTAMRQLGVRSALAIFHQLIYNEWASGSLATPLARIQVDEQNCFGMIEWNAVRKAAGHLFPKHVAAARPATI